MATFEILVTSEAQSFDIDLAGIEYNVILKWNYLNETWVIDLSKETTLILSGIPLVLGVDLLEPYGYLNIGGKLVISTDSKDVEPKQTYENLGTIFRLYFITS